MALFDEVLSDVYTITKRPDLVAETKMAVKAATVKAHQSSYWDRDLYETGIEFLTEDTEQSFAYSNLIPRWRAAKYFRKHTGVVGGEGDLFKIITTDGMFDQYALQKDNIVYLAGEYFNFKSYTAFKFMLLGCYLNPITLETTYDSWIALNHRYAIVFEAARTIFKAIGADQEAVYYRDLVREEYANLLTTNTLAFGY